MKETYTHTHTFPGGITATATLDAARGDAGFKVEWSQFPPPRRVIPEYLRWRQTILEDFTRKTGFKVMLVDLVNFKRR